MNLNGRELTLPIIQGGMGIGISMGGLAGAVASCGAMGVISAANPGFEREDFFKNPWEANVEGLKAEIKKAKEIAKGKGLIAINAMVAGAQFESLVKTAVDAGVDCIISGAGLPLQLPRIVEGSDVLIAPIISSGRGAGILTKLWHTKYKRCPDFVVIEGPRAGGHLGFSEKELRSGTTQTLETILAEVKAALAPWEKQYGRVINVFVAGSVNTAQKIKDILKLGADGIQVATRFIATKECDASEAYKQVYINATNKDIALIQSPVGMEARAIKTPMLQRLEEMGRLAPKYCVTCIQKCDPKTTPYCITNALIRAQKGDYENGLFFCDDDVDVVTEMTTVKAVLDELSDGWR